MPRKPKALLAELPPIPGDYDSVLRKRGMGVESAGPSITMQKSKRRHIA